MNVMSVRRSGQWAMLAVLLCGTPAGAQPLAIDKAVSAWSAEQQQTADVLSNVALWSTVGLGVWDAWQADDRKAALVRMGLRAGIAQGATFAAKKLVRRARPCVPSCGLEQPYTSFWSGHTSLAFASLGDKRIAFSLPLAVSTGQLRIAGGKHWATDVLAGAVAGLVTQWVIR